MATSPVARSKDLELNEGYSTERKLKNGEKDTRPGAIVDLANPDAFLTVDEKTKADRKLRGKLDARLIPWLCILYLLSFLDRTNIGNARAGNLTKDLGISDSHYNAALTVFFISYALAEPATNVLLKTLRPSVFIPIIMILWGLCMTFMGLVTNWSGLMAARWFLGLTEAGLFPGINYYLSCWYKRSEFGVRAAIFFSAAAVSGSFGGLLAAGIVKMEGVAGLHGWQWLFIIEGAVTVLIGVTSFWIVVDFPDTATFLSIPDRVRVINRLRADKQASAYAEQFDVRWFYEALRDYKMWLGMFIYMGCDMSLYAFSLFLPTIVRNMNVGDETMVQLWTVAPYVAGCTLTIAIGYFADRTRQRGLCNIFVSLLGVAGFAMLIASSNMYVNFGGTFLAAMGIYPCIANTITWVSNNIEGVYKRGIVLGFVIGWGNLNGIVSSNIFTSPTDRQSNIIGYYVIMAYLLICLCGGSILMRFLLARENKKRRAGDRDYLVQNADGSLKTADEIRLLGDKRPDFFYIL